MRELKIPIDTIYARVQACTKILNVVDLGQTGGCDVFYENQFKPKAMAEQLLSMSEIRQMRQN